jgi:hypothetical protein
MSVHRRTRVITGVAVAAAVALGVSLGLTATSGGSSASPVAQANAAPITVSQGSGNFTDYQVVPASDPKEQASLLQSLCNTPPSGVTCSFAPSGPVTPVLGHYELVDHLVTCDAEGEMKVKNTFTTEMSTSLGVQLSEEVGKIISTDIEADFATTWSSSSETVLIDSAPIPSYSVGFAYRAAPLLQATGTLLIRAKNAFELETPHNTNPAYMTYQLDGVVFDAPDTSPSAHDAIAFVSRKLSQDEIAHSCKPLSKAKKAAPSPTT